MVMVNPAAIEQQEREAIQEYLGKHNINGLVQGLVDGLLRDRPETKPMEHFAHMLRMQLLREQGDSGDQGALREASKVSEVPGRLLRDLFEATKNITSEIVPKDTITIIIQETIKLLRCDRVSLFVYDKRIDMLVLNASNLETPIRVKPGQGISGHVFKTGETVNIPDCYKDSRFDQSFDKMTGYRTNNLLTMVIKDFEGETMGVVQAINKLDSTHFSHVDEILLENLTLQVSIALRNAEVYRAAIVQSERASALLQMIQSLSQDLGAQSLILTVTMHANELVQADRCTVFLVDEKKQQLWSISTDSGKEIRIPKSAGIAGECATEGKLIAIPDAYEDSRFNQEIDRKTGYRTKSILAVPLLRRHGTMTALAVIQMINKTEFDGEIGKFDEEDIQVMETFATFVASKLESASIVASSSTKQDSEAGLAADLSSHKKRRESTKQKHQDAGAILEEEEDEEEEG